MIITSLENNIIKKYLKLKNKKNRYEDKLFIVEGEHLVEEAIKNDLLLIYNINCLFIIMILYNLFII